MNYTNEQFNALAPYEDNFRTAVEGDWTRRVPLAGQQLIRSTYESATKTRIPFNAGCASCLINLLKRAGRLWFADQKERAARPATAAAPESEQKTLNVPGFENVPVHPGNVPVSNAEKPAESAPEVPAKKSSGRHRKGGKSTPKSEKK